MHADYKSMSDRHKLLTPRQLEICLQIASGKKQKQIAAESGVGFRTISRLLIISREKMGLRNDLELMRYMIIKGLA